MNELGFGGGDCGALCDNRSVAGGVGERGDGEAFAGGAVVPSILRRDGAGWLYLPGN